MSVTFFPAQSQALETSLAFKPLSTAVCVCDQRPCRHAVSQRCRFFTTVRPAWFRAVTDGLQVSQLPRVGSLPRVHCGSLGPGLRARPLFKEP